MAPAGTLDAPSMSSPASTTHLPSAAPFARSARCRLSRTTSQILEKQEKRADGRDDRLHPHTSGRRRNGYGCG